MNQQDLANRSPQAPPAPGPNSPFNLPPAPPRPHLGDLLYAYSGRINRAKWWAMVAIIIVIWIVLEIALAVLLGVKLQDIIEPTVASNRLLSIASLAANAIVLWPWIAVCAKRLQDRNRPGWIILPLALLSFAADALIVAGFGGPVDGLSVPVIVAYGLQGLVTIYLVIDLGILRGTRGPNRYGDDPIPHVP
jgi:uncharacterized membrane protein YhaH (DUF805 family)